MARAKKLPAVLTEDEQELFLQQANPRYPTGEHPLERCVSPE